jgi:hypothetical protein
VYAGDGLLIPLDRNAIVKIHIDLEIPSGVKRVVAIAAAGSVLFLGGAVAYAQTAGTSSDTLIGSALNSLGNAVALLQAQVAALQAADHVTRATLAPSGALIAQSGKWLSRVDHPFAGNYVVTFTPGAFSAAPTCVATPLAHESADPSALGGPTLSAAMLACSPATLYSVTCQARAGDRGGVPLEIGLSMICVGP